MINKKLLRNLTNKQKNDKITFQLNKKRDKNLILQLNKITRNCSLIIFPQQFFVCSNNFTS